VQFAERVVQEQRIGRPVPARAVEARAAALQLPQAFMKTTLWSERETVGDVESWEMP
jgi:hypothetical protein